MLDRLPELIDPLSFADKGSELIGQIDLSSLDRLAEMLADDSGSVAVRLVFGREGRLATIEGQIGRSMPKLSTGDGLACRQQDQTWNCDFNG